ncbi:uncharacterized protein [Drosophila tropicalis]|uniref:uncharacterized protein n=1 Tax=Drosophila tropicalis TaxID=46794 RepID=UPI0035ABFFD8
MLKILWFTLLLYQLTIVLATDYELLLEDPDIFSPCTEGVPGSVGIGEIFDLSQIEYNQDSDVIHVSGNATTTWDIQPTDRIAGSFAIFHNERGNWEPTVFSMSTQDFCSSMYNADSYWYKSWTKHITNKNEVQSKCLNTPGTLLVHEPFDVQLVIYNVRGSAQGRYKVVVTLEAFDEKNMRRETSLCFEIRGEVEKLKRKK